MESISRASEPREFLALLERAVALDLAYEQRLPHASGRSAAVLVLWALSERGPALLLTRRTETLETHRGQIAFPGGTSEPGDADATATALRESAEEVGLEPARVSVAGILPPLLTVTGFEVDPVVAVHADPVESVRLVPNPHEIAEMFWVPLAELLREGVFVEEKREWQGRSYLSPAYLVGERRIWGATAAMLKNLLDRLSALG